MSFETPKTQKFDLSVFSCSSCPGLARFFFLFRFVEGFKYVKFKLNLDEFG